MSNPFEQTLDTLYNTDGYTQLAVVSVIALATFYYLFWNGRSSPEKQQADLARSVVTPITSEQSTTRHVSESLVDTTSSVITTGVVTSMATVVLESAAAAEEEEEEEEDKQVPDNLSDISGSSVDSDVTAVGTVEQVSNKEHQEFETGVFEEKAITVERSLGSENEATSPCLTKHVQPTVMDPGNEKDTPSLAEKDAMDQDAECTLLEIDDASKKMELTTKIEEGTQQTVSQSVTENLQDGDTDQLYMKKSTNDVCNPAANDTDEIVQQHESSTVVDTIITTEHMTETIIDKDITVSTMEAVTEEIAMTMQTGMDDELVRETTTESLTETAVSLDEDKETVTSGSICEPTTSVEETTAESVTEATLTPDEDKETITSETNSELTTVVEETTTVSVTETTVSLDDDKETITSESISEPATVFEETKSVITSGETENMMEADKTMNDNTLQEERTEESVQPRGVEFTEEADIESQDDTVEPTMSVKVLNETVANEQEDEPVKAHVKTMNLVEIKGETLELVTTPMDDVSIKKETEEQDDTVTTIAQDDQTDTNDVSSTDSETQIEPVEPTEPAAQVNNAPIEKNVIDAALEMSHPVDEPVDCEALVEAVELEGRSDPLDDTWIEKEADALEINHNIDELVTPADTNEPANRLMTTLEDTNETVLKEQAATLEAETNTNPVTLTPFIRANPLNKPKQEMSRVERIEQQRQPYIPLYKSRCAFWPGCTNNHCKYYHPFIECRNGKACQYGKKCVFLHPKDYSTQSKGGKTKGKKKANTQNQPTSNEPATVKMESTL